MGDPDKDVVTDAAKLDIEHIAVGSSRPENCLP
jgi:hypothetical protein